MSSRPILAGVPTVEINLSRYDELLHAEVKCEQYKKAFENTHTSLVSIIEASGTIIDAEVGTDPFNK